MPFDHPQENISRSADITFKCGACGRMLSIPHHQAGVSGPCPECGTLVDSPTPCPASHLPGLKKNIFAPDVSQQVKKRKRGNVSADLAVDQQRLEQTDSDKTLKILALTILVVCLCLAVTWYLRG